MKIPSAQLRLDTTNKTAELRGFEGGARAFLREAAADLVKADGSIRSGYLRLSEGRDGVTLKGGHVGSGATAATALIKDLVQQAYGERASQALEVYLSGKSGGRNKVGTQSFVKLIKSLEADGGPARTGEIDQVLNRAQVATGARLRTDALGSQNPGSAGVAPGQGLRNVYGVEMPEPRGTPLNQQAQPLTDRDLSCLAEGLMQGLNDMAAHHAVHKDIKPENVRYDASDGRVQLTGFGALERLSKASAPLGERPKTNQAGVQSPGFTPPWWTPGEAFGVERDRYAAAMTLLAAAIPEPRNAAGLATSPTQVIAEAMADFKRDAQRHGQILGDVLAHLGERNPAAHRSLEERLQRNPGLRDFLGDLFGSSVPGPQADNRWKTLQRNHFVAAPKVWHQLQDRGLGTRDLAQACAARSLGFIRAVPHSDFQLLNSISGSPLVQAVYEQPELLSPQLSPQQRASRYTALADRAHQRELERLRNQPRSDADTPEEHALGLAENLKSAKRSHLTAVASDLQALNDPESRALLQRTVVEGKNAGLTVFNLDTLGRGETYAKVKAVTDADLAVLIDKIFNRADLDPKDIAVAKYLWPPLTLA